MAPCPIGAVEWAPWFPRFPGWLGLEATLSSWVFIFASLPWYGGRMSSTAGCGPLTGDTNPAELPTKLPSQTGLPAQLCRWVVSGWNLCSRTAASRNAVHQDWSAGNRKLWPPTLSLIPTGPCGASWTWAFQEASHNSGGTWLSTSCFFPHLRNYSGAFSVSLCWPAGGRFGQCYTPLTLLMQSFSVSAPGGCFSLPSGFWDFHSSALLMRSC